MTIKLRKQMFDHLLDGTKKSTSRLGVRDVEIGEELTFEMTEDETVTYKTVVTDVFISKFSELTEREAKREGYASLKDLKEALTEIYNPAEEDLFTLIHFT